MPKYMSNTVKVNTCLQSERRLVAWRAILNFHQKITTVASANRLFYDKQVYECGQCKSRENHLSIDLTSRKYTSLANTNQQKSILSSAIDSVVRHNAWIRDRRSKRPNLLRRSFV